MTPTEKAVAAVSRLTRLTIEGSIHWRPLELLADIRAHPEEHVRAAYETEYDSQRLVIYQRWSHHEEWDESDNRRTWSEQDVGLVVVDRIGKVTWRFPFVSGLSELLEAAQYQASDIDNLLDRLLEAPNRTPNSAA